jgi:hypothetical protein
MYESIHAFLYEAGIAAVAIVLKDRAFSGLPNKFDM